MTTGSNKNRAAFTGAAQNDVPPFVGVIETSHTIDFDEVRATQRVAQQMFMFFNALLTHPEIMPFTRPDSGMPMQFYGRYHLYLRSGLSNMAKLCHVMKHDFGMYVNDPDSRNLVADIKREGQVEYPAGGFRADRVVMRDDALKRWDTDFTRLRAGFAYYLAEQGYDENTVPHVQTDPVFVPVQAYVAGSICRLCAGENAASILGVDVPQAVRTA